MSKKNNTKKPRSHQIYLGYKEPFQGVRHSNDGNVEIMTLSGEWVKPDHVHTEHGYERDSGKKKHTTFIFDAHVQDFFSYLQSFDCVFAIDTNTRNINGLNVSCTAMLQIFIQPADEQHVSVTFAGPFFQFYKNGIAGLDEKLATVLLISNIKQNPQLKEGAKIAIITDHDLGGHGEYNNQKKPFYKKITLPTGIKLFYASADKKNDNVCTLAVSRCDEEAAKHLSFFEQNGFFGVGGRAIPVEQLMDVDNHSGRIGVPVFKQTS